MKSNSSNPLFPTILEVLLFVFAAFAVSIGWTDSIASNLQFSRILTGLPVVLALAVAIVMVFKDPTRRIPVTLALGFAAAALISVHLSDGAPLGLQPRLIYFLVIMTAAFLGTAYAWFFPFCLIVLVETVHLFVTTGVSFQAWISDTPEKAILSFCALLGLFSTGFISSRLISRLAPANSSEAPEAVKKSEEPPLPPKTYTPETPVKTQTSTYDHSSEISSDGDKDVKDLLASVVYFMGRNFRAYSALGFIYEPDLRAFCLNSFQSKSMHVIKGIKIPLGKGIVGRIGVEKKIFMSGDLSFYNSDIMYYSANEQINSILAVPIISDDHELLGALILDSPDKQTFKDMDRENLKRFSSLAAALITNARMRIFQERVATTSHILYEASHQFTTALNINDVFEVLFNVVPSVVNCTRMVSLVYNEESRRAVVAKIVGPSPDMIEGFEFPINTGLYSFVFQKRRRVKIADFKVCEGKYYRFIPNEAANPSTRSLLILPITDDESRCPGLFSIEHDQPNQFTNGIEQVLATLVENASVAFTRALLYQRMELLATTDGLTSLNNHRNFQELLAKEIERSRRHKRPLSLLLMDIDHFKTFNDTYGHPVGDLVLKEIALCIRKSIRVNDIPARYGGEEFTVIVPEENETGAFTVAERIRSTIENHVIVSLGRQLRVTVSIGCATYPTLADSQSSLIENADKALYYSKENGRNRITIFERGMTGK